MRSKSSFLAISLVISAVCFTGCSYLYDIYGSDHCQESCFIDEEGLERSMEHRDREDQLKVQEEAIAKQNKKMEEQDMEFQSLRHQKAVNDKLKKFQ